MEELKDELEALNKYLDHEDPIVAGIAKDISVLRKGVYDGDLSQEQFEELVDDLMEMDEVRRMASNLERKIKILQAFNTIKTIVGIGITLR